MGRRRSSRSSAGGSTGGRRSGEAKEKKEEGAEEVQWEGELSDEQLLEHAVRVSEGAEEEDREGRLRSMRLVHAMLQARAQPEEMEISREFTLLAGELLRVHERYARPQGEGEGENVGEADADEGAAICMRAECCIVEILRIFAPDAPYDAEQLGRIFTALIQRIQQGLSMPSLQQQQGIDEEEEEEKKEQEEEEEAPAPRGRSRRGGAKARSTASKSKSNNPSKQKQQQQQKQQKQEQEEHGVEDPRVCAAYILRSLANVASCLILVELVENNIPGALDLLHSFFEGLLANVQPHHNRAVGAGLDGDGDVLDNTVKVLTLCISEMEGASPTLRDTLLSCLLPSNEQQSPASHRVTQQVLMNTWPIMQTVVLAFLTQSLQEEQHVVGATSSAATDTAAAAAKANVATGGTTSSFDATAFHRELTKHVFPLIYQVQRIAPEAIVAMLPTLTAQLQNANDNRRLDATTLLGSCFVAPGSTLVLDRPRAFTELLGRLQDSVPAIREHAISVASTVLCQFRHQRSLRSNLLSRIVTRLEDPEHSVRRKALNAICDMFLHDWNLTPEDEPALHAIGGRLRDRNLHIRLDAIAGLSKLFAAHVTKHIGQLRFESDGAMDVEGTHRDEAVHIMSTRDPLAAIFQYCRVPIHQVSSDSSLSTDDLEDALEEDVDGTGESDEDADDDSDEEDDDDDPTAKKQRKRRSQSNLRLRLQLLSWIPRAVLQCFTSSQDETTRLRVEHVFDELLIPSELDERRRGVALLLIVHTLDNAGKEALRAMLDRKRATRHALTRVLDLSAQWRRLSAAATAATASAHSSKARKAKTKGKGHGKKKTQQQLRTLGAESDMDLEQIEARRAAVTDELRKESKVLLELCETSDGRSSALKAILDCNDQRVTNQLKAMCGSMWTSPNANAGGEDSDDESDEDSDEGDADADGGAGVEGSDGVGSKHLCVMSVERGHALRTDLMARVGSKTAQGEYIARLFRRCALLTVTRESMGFLMDTLHHFASDPADFADEGEDEDDNGIERAQNVTDFYHPPTVSAVHAAIATTLNIVSVPFPYLWAGLHKRTGARMTACLARLTDVVSSSTTAVLSGAQRTACESVLLSLLGILLAVFTSAAAPATATAGAGTAAEGLSPPSETRTIAMGVVSSTFLKASVRNSLTQLALTMAHCHDAPGILSENAARCLARAARLADHVLQTSAYADPVDLDEDEDDSEDDEEEDDDEDDEDLVFPRLRALRATCYHLARSSCGKPGAGDTDGDSDDDDDDDDDLEDVLTLESPYLLCGLECLAVLADEYPGALLPIAEHASNMIKAYVLGQKSLWSYAVHPPRGMDEPSSSSDGGDCSENAMCFLASLKALSRIVLAGFRERNAASAMDDSTAALCDSIQGTAPELLSLLTNMLEKDGAQLTVRVPDMGADAESEASAVPQLFEVPDAVQSEARLACGRALLHLILSSDATSAKKLGSRFGVAAWHRLGRLVQDEDPRVRHAFVAALCKCLLEARSVYNTVRFLPYLALCATISDVPLRKLAEDTFVQCAKRMRLTYDQLAASAASLSEDAREERLRKIMVLSMPEYVFPYLLHLLAHHPDFPEDREMPGSAVDTSAVAEQPQEDEQEQEEEDKAPTRGRGRGRSRGRGRARRPTTTNSASSSSGGGSGGGSGSGSGSGSGAKPYTADFQEYLGLVQQQAGVFRKYLTFLLHPLLQFAGTRRAENLPLLLHLSDLILQSHCDAFEPASRRLHGVTTIARRVLRDHIRTQANVQHYTGRVSLPQSLFKRHRPSLKNSALVVAIAQEMRLEQATGTVLSTPLPMPSAPVKGSHAGTGGGGHGGGVRSATRSGGTGGAGSGRSRKASSKPGHKGSRGGTARRGNALRELTEEEVPSNNKNRNASRSGASANATRAKKRQRGAAADGSDNEEDNDKQSAAPPAPRASGRPSRHAAQAASERVRQSFADQKRADREEAAEIRRSLGSASKRRRTANTSSSTTTTGSKSQPHRGSAGAADGVGRESFLFAHDASQGDLSQSQSQHSFFSSVDNW